MRIAILLHARQRRIVDRGYRLWALQRVWEDRGIRVDRVWGPAARIDADVLIPHVDLTAMPREYAAVLDAHPCVVNRAVRDCSKRRVSRNLVRPGDGYEGAVVVKTDRNHGGLPEVGILPWIPRALARAALRLSPLGRARNLDPERYPVFPSVRDVPPAVFSNPHLVVERFLPEREGDRYFVRYYSFFGDRHVCLRRHAQGPVVRFHSSACEEVPVPDEILAERRRLGFDYGKFDFVVHDGTPVLLDANPTPSLPAQTDAESARLLVGNLADGILAYARRNQA